jgi:Fe2+ or Zn2+ uptake regulation protein
VYNALDALCSAGLARRLATAAGPCRFDADLSDHCHVATDDGRLIDVPVDTSSALVGSLPIDTIRDLSERLGVDITRVSITLHASESVPADDAPRARDDAPVTAAVDPVAGVGAAAAN